MWLGLFQATACCWSLKINLSPSTNELASKTLLPLDNSYITMRPASNVSPIVRDDEHSYSSLGYKTYRGVSR